MSRHEQLSVTELTSRGPGKSEFGVGAPSHASITVQEYGDGLLHKTVLTCVDTPISIADDAGVAQYGGVKIYDFPEGVIMTDGALIDGLLTGGVTGTIIDAFTGVCALGSAVAGTGATLITTEATILQSTAIGTASSKVSAVKAFPIATQLTEAGSRWIDGHTTPVDAYLNVAIADDATHTAGTMKFTGTITIWWKNLGDL